MDISFLRRDTTSLPGTIALMSAPGRERALAADLDELVEKHGCVALVSLTSDRELDILRIADLPDRAAARGIRLIRFPIGDFSTPDSNDGIVALTAELIHIARAGGMVAIHCWAGLGRTGLVAACCLVALGFRPDHAIATVRQCRPRAIENSDQEEFVFRFAPALAAVEPRDQTGADRPAPESWTPCSKGARDAARVLLCAGAGADPQGTLYQALVTAGHDVFAPDYRGLDVATAADILMYQILERPRQEQILVGHSFGGAVALLAALEAADKGTTVTGVILCAPALFLARSIVAPARLPRPPAPSVLVHGVDDKVIPIELSRGFAREHDLPLIEVNDGHSLRRSLDTVTDAVATVGRGVDGSHNPQDGGPFL